jgi:hypothetical protein
MFGLSASVALFIDINDMIRGVMVVWKINPLNALNKKKLRIFIKQNHEHETDG